MPQAFTTRRFVEFVDTDMAGIVHFSAFFRYMEAAEHELLRSLGLSVHTKLADDLVISFPRVSRHVRLYLARALRRLARHRGHRRTARHKEHHLRFRVHPAPRRDRNRQDDRGLLPTRARRCRQSRSRCRLKSRRLSNALC